uniref:thioredoxin domain-containing protein 9 isoform X1 n=2 Tax=Myxine glutinosa TaxID=7769 RepID=UPI0035901383
MAVGLGSEGPEFESRWRCIHQHLVCPPPCTLLEKINPLKEAGMEGLEQSMLAATQEIEKTVDQKLALLDNLDEDTLEKLREQRLEALRRAQSQKQEFERKGHGSYREIPSERDFFAECKGSKNVVCHFYRDTTDRCAIFDRHLGLLAPRHFKTKFLRLNVEKAPYLCKKLSVRILPSLLLFRDNKVCDRVVGFDDMGGVDDFPTEALEWRLGQAGVITYTGSYGEQVVLQPKTARKGLQRVGPTGSDDESD